MGKLLIVDDDRQVLESMTDWLRDQGLEVDASPGYADALERLGSVGNGSASGNGAGGGKGGPYDVLLSDIRLQDGDGFDLLEQTLRRSPATQVVLMTGYGTADSAVDAVRAGAFDFLTKPLIDDELLMSIERALGQRKVIEENTQLKEELDRKHGLGHIVGADPRMLRVFDMIESIADTRAT
ncbi:MAG: response regulator, partial [Planctomycetota bacterium]